MPGLQSRRSFLASTLATAGAIALPWGRSAGASLSSLNDVRLGFIGCGGRGGELLKAFSGLDGAVVAGLCDADTSRVDAIAKRFPQARKFNDLRDLVADPNLDAVVVATCNHWHCLAAIWAMEAGKDVYVEKPLSHTQWEGLQTVKTARKLSRICQMGTQQRSDPLQAEIKQFLHEERALGAIQSARVNRFGVREQIGKRTEPLPIPKEVNHDLWLGPAQDEPIYRDKLHYDWHWDFNTGSGEMGNWGVHVLDDCRNNVFLDKVTLPKRIFGGGGRVVYNDAGNTPNVHFIYFDTGSIPVVIGLSNLPAAPGSNKSPKHPGAGSGYIAYCEGGRLEGQRGRAVAYDNNDKVVREFKGDGGMGRHQQNFLDAVRAQDRSLLNTEVAVGHASTGWCNLANVAFQVGAPLAVADARSVDVPQWQSMVDEMQTHLNAHGLKLDDAQLRLSPMLEVDVASEQFVGSHSAAANGFLKREYRSGFEVREVV